MAEFAATLHDGTTLAGTVEGSGPAVLLPVRTAPHDTATAEGVRQWGGDPDLGAALVTGLADRFRVITADYEGHRLAHPAAGTLTPDALSADLLAIADAAGADRFAYYGYSWLALAGLHLALRTDRLWGLAMGGYPPAGGPYRAMLDVTRAAHEKALVPREPVDGPVAPGDWDAAGITVGARVTAQFVTLYEALQDFDDTTAQREVTVPRLAFAGSEDAITYGPGWGDTVVEIAPPLTRHRADLVDQGWSVELLDGLDHMSAMHGKNVLPLLRPWLLANAPDAATRRGGARS